MNKFLKISFFTATLIATLFIAGCTDDIADEITELETSRLFSPSGLDVRIVNQTAVRLNWKPVKNAVSYNIEIHENAELDFSGVPVKAVSNVFIDQLPFIIPGLDGETSYSVRVNATGAEIAESKWSSAVFKTDAEQILFDIDPEEISPNSVIIRWPAGETATDLVLTTDETKITRPVTAAEVAAGAAEVIDLESETLYTVILMNGEKVRGRKTFTTLIDVSGTIIVNPEDDLKALLETAEEGDIFSIMPGTYLIAGNIEIHKTIEIIGAMPTDRPIINGAALRMFGGAGIRLKDIIFDGASTPDGNQTIIYNEVLPAGQTYGDVLIEDCIIRNYVKGVFYVNIAALIESVTIRNNIYHNIQTAGGDFIDFRSGITKKFDFINNTVYNSAPDRDLFRMDGGGSTNFPSVNSILTISNNTFHNIIGVNTRRILYIRLASHEITVSKNIFSETMANYSNQSATKVVSMSGNNYHNAPNLKNSEFTVHDTGGTTFNPGFANPGAGNFTVSHEELKFQRIGDPRWLP
jgi:hypothetical protein